MSASQEEPLHSFPQPVFETLCRVSAPLIFAGLFVFGILHFLSEPCFQQRQGEYRSRRTCRGWFCIVVVFYVFPCTLISSALGSLDESSQGALRFALVFEAAVNAYFLCKTRYRLYPRLGRRVMFLAMSVILGASMYTDQYNQIDYYGPVRVTNVELEFERPEQEINTYHPSYYYFYRLQQTIEWGNTWGCPASKSKRWCVAMDDLYAAKCQKLISCQGKPEDYHDGGKGECATASQRSDAFLYLFQCWIEQASLEGLGPFDFQSTSFDKQVAPWDDPLHPHTVTRAVSCDLECTAQTLEPPILMKREAFVEWLAGALLVLIGCGLLAKGVSSGQEGVSRQTGGFEPVADAEVVHAHDLESSDRGGPDVPVVRATPVV